MKKNKQDWMKNIMMHDYVKVNNDVYFFSLNFNGLYKKNLLTKELEFLGSAPNELTFRKHLYGAIIEHNAKLYMPPMNGDEICIYDISSKSFCKRALNFDAKDMASKFYGALSYENKVIFIPGRYPYIVVIDTEKEEIEYIDCWRKLLVIPDDYKGFYVKNGFFIKENILYIATMVDGCIIKLNLDTYQCEKVQMISESEGYLDMCLDEENDEVWMICYKNHHIIRYNEKTMEEDILDNFPENYVINEYGENKESTMPFINIICCDKNVYAIAYQANMTVKIDKQTSRITEVVQDTRPEYKGFNEWKARHYFGKVIDQEHWILANIDDNSFYLMQGDRLKEIINLYDENSRGNLLFYAQEYVVESGVYGVGEYIKYIKSLK